MMVNTKVELHSTIALDVLYDLDVFPVENPGYTGKY